MTHLSAEASHSQQLKQPVLLPRLLRCSGVIQPLLPLVLSSPHTSIYVEEETPGGSSWPPSPAQQHSTRNSGVSSIPIILLPAAPLLCSQEEWGAGGRLTKTQTDLVLLW